MKEYEIIRIRLERFNNDEWLNRMLKRPAMKDLFYKAITIFLSEEPWNTVRKRLSHSPHPDLITFDIVTNDKFKNKEHKWRLVIDEHEAIPISEQTMLKYIDQAEVVLKAERRRHICQN